MSKETVNTPAFDSYVNHLISLGSLHTLMNCLEVLDWINSKEDSNPYLQHQATVWEDHLTTHTALYNKEAKAELDQLFLVANIIVTRNLIRRISESLKRVENELSKENLLGKVREYNKRPQRKLRKHNTDERTWVVTNEWHTLDEELVKQFIKEDIYDIKVLPAFQNFCEEYLSFEIVSKKASETIKFDESFDGKTNPSKHDELTKVFSRLQNEGCLEIRGRSYFWKGIGRSKIGSLATLARYLEEVKIVRGYSSMEKAFHAYSRKFNIDGKDQNEWNKKYSPNGELSFNDKDKFWAKLGYVLELRNHIKPD